MTKEQQFGLHKAYGVSTSSPKKKATRYQLIETVGGNKKILNTVHASQYGVLVQQKKNLNLYNPGFYNGKTAKLDIKPLYD